MRVGKLVKVNGAIVGAARPRLVLLRSLLLAPVLLIATLAGGGAGIGTPGANGQSTTVGGSGPPAVPSGTATTSAFDRQGMWIWYVSKSSGGSPGAIISRAQHSGVGTVYIKAGDGTSPWSQFSSSLVSALHNGGLKVCAWQFVYGDHPSAEAKIGAAAVAKGADCLVIDAESQYEGKYASASKYMNILRARIGPSVPLSLAGFPYVDYHPGFPYSVFFGPGGADASQPQMYWKTIGTSVATNYAHTYTYNRIYKRPIYPLGQTYANPGVKGIKRFRSLALSYGANGVSWWDWQETTGKEWSALHAAVHGVSGFTPTVTHPLLKKGSKGDMVVWAQELLVSAGQTQLPVTGIYAARTKAAVVSFQSQKGLGADGVLGTSTWQALLQYSPTSVNWAAPRALGRASTSAAAHGRAPLSASLPARRNEIKSGLRP
jgi:peptidoglycan hydrolase-like protein with peptidoglycan-binding domain